MYLVYKITREDGLLYIGTSNTKSIKKRISQHKRSKRFSNLSFVFDIIEQHEDFDYIMNIESYYIQKYDTFFNGLNDTSDGKCVRNGEIISTKDYRYSEESRKKMSDSAKRRVERCGIPFKNKSHTEDQKNKWSRDRSGLLPSNTKLTEQIVYDICENFMVDDDIEDIGKIMKNGRPMSHIRAFSIKYSTIYNVTPELIEMIIKGKVWKNVERKYSL